MYKSKLIGKKVTITSKDSLFSGEWGTVIGYDGDNYHVAIADGRNSVPIFSRHEFKVHKEKR